MGDYILRIQAKPQVVDGITYYNAVFAYKPYGGLGCTRINGELHRRTCLPATRAWGKRKSEERAYILVNYHGNLYVLKYCHGTVWDYEFDRRAVGQVFTPYCRRRKIVMFSPSTDPSRGNAA